MLMIESLMILLHLQTATDWHIYSSVFISCNPETWHGKLKHCKRFCFYLREKITSSLHWLFAISVKASSWLIGLILRWSWTFFCPHHWKAANSSNQSYPHVGQWRMLLTRNVFIHNLTWFGKWSERLLFFKLWHIACYFLYSLLQVNILGQRK